MDGEEAHQSAVALIDRVLDNFLVDLEKKEIRLTVADVLRLIDLRRQLAHNELSEVRVTWVESNAAPSVTNP